MSFLRTTLAAAIAAVGLSGAAAAENFTFYGEAGGWNIFVDNQRSTCVMERKDDNGNVVQMGPAPAEGEGVAYVGVFTQSETAVEKDQMIPVVIKLGDYFYSGQSRGMRGNITEGFTGGYILTDDPQFIEDIGRQFDMIVFPSVGNAFVVNLAGTLKGIRLGRECIAEQQAQ